MALWQMAINDHWDPPQSDGDWHKIQPTEYPKHELNMVALLFGGKWFAGYRLAAKKANAAIVGRNTTAISPTELPKLEVLFCLVKRIYRIGHLKQRYYLCDPSPSRLLQNIAMDLIANKFWDWCRQQVKPVTRFYLSRYNARTTLHAFAKACENDLFLAC
jgi:hypothetical protein